jgi:hypothetical protein
LVALAAALGLWAPPARAVVYNIKIVEVFPGTAAQPNAQYVVLQTFAPNQNEVDTYKVSLFDASDTPIASFPFTADVPNGISQSKILIATPEAEALFGVTADLAMTPSLTLAGGAVCFGPPQGEGLGWIHCFHWGSFADDAANATVFGTPFRPATGLTQGQAAVCDLSRGLNPNSLDAADCSDPADDYACGDARPQANPVGSTPGFLAATPSCPDEQHLLGKFILLKDPQPGVDPTRRKLVIKAREAQSPNPLTGNPVTGGATLEILVDGAAPSSQTFVLPSGAAFWRALGTGYQYRDGVHANGPIKRLVFTKSADGTFVLSVVGDGRVSPLDLLPPDPGTEARIRLVPGSGGDPYCVSFGRDAGGSLGPNTGTMFKATSPSGEGLCPP